MKISTFIAAPFLLMAVFSGLAYAACPCTTAGQREYDTTDLRYEFCNGTNWVNMSSGMPTSGLIAHWKLDESAGTSAADSAGSNTGTLTGGPTWQSAGGMVAGALDFDGVDDIVNAGSAAAVDNIATFTISAWIYPRTIGENNGGWIIGKATGANLPTNGWMLSLTSDETNSIKFAADFSSSHAERYGTANRITLNAWNHVVVTWTGATGAGNTHIYVNNAEIAYSFTDNGSGSRASDAANNISIGNNPATSRTFNGRIDDVRIYNRILSTSEIADLYNLTGSGC